MKKRIIIPSAARRLKRPVGETMVEFDAFAGDIDYGGLRNMLEIKILVCYMLSRLKDPLTRKQLGDCLTETGLVNYFAQNEALDELIGQGIVLQKGGADEKQTLSITEEGKKLASTLETTLRPTTRDRAVSAALRQSARAKAERENKAEIIRTDTGYRVLFVIYGFGEEVMRLSLFAADALQAAELRDRFLNDPAALYSAVIDQLTGK